MKVGDKIRIIDMCGQPWFEYLFAQCRGKEGVVEEIATDQWGDTYANGTWGECALYLSEDTYEIIN